MSRRIGQSRILAVCHRSGYLALVVLEGEQVLLPLTFRPRSAAAIAEDIGDVATDYNVDLVVLEPAICGVGVNLEATRIQRLPLASAKEVLLQANVPRSHRALFDHLVTTYPDLRRHVTLLPVTHEIAISEKWRTIILLAVALGLAAQRLAETGELRNLRT